MFCKRFLVLACVCALVLVAGSVNADLIGTYVDATASNTTPGSALSATNSDTDNLWWDGDIGPDGVRNNTVFISQGGTSEDAPMLTMSVNGLANDTYNVYGVYWTHPDTDWNIQMALPGDSLTVYDKTNGIFTGNTREGSLQEMQVMLGQVTGSSFSVNFDDVNPSGRSWFDGVAYEAVPEPSTIALLVTGLFGLLAYAWRKRK